MFVLAFVYGGVHAAGPGHGKTIAMTYVLTSGGSYRSGAFLGAMIALTHAGSAIMLVFLLQVVLDVSISRNMDSAIRITQIVSYALICLIGLYILMSSIKAWHKKEQNKDINRQEAIINSPLSAAITIGMVPCPGVIMILLFCLALGQSLLGFLLCCMVSIGMALTITLAVGISLSAKKLVFQLPTWGRDRQIYTEYILHCLSGVVLAIIGGLLLLASW
jgi:ABC-type nickel/cobalt efflux system permease component RcnA